MRLYDFERLFRAVALAGIPRRPVSVLELGAQESRDLGGYTRRIFEALGWKHASVDLTGEGGSTVVDLCGLPRLDWRGEWDVVTDFGTIEHVEDQDAAWRAVDYYCRGGGLMVHALPRSGHWLGHSNHHYTTTYMRLIAKRFGYDVLEIEDVDDRTPTIPSCGLVWAAFRKRMT